jgi:hypothetical protein
MKTYNTYQEAKIANPDSEIYAYACNFLPECFIQPSHETYDRRGYFKCKPADYCMTLEKFLDDGYETVKGDVYLCTRGIVQTVHSDQFAKNMNNHENSDSRRYILRAKALEDKMNEEIKWESPMLKKLKEMQKKDRDNCINNLFDWGFITEKEKIGVIAACDVHEIKIGMTCSDDGMGEKLEQEDVGEWDGSGLPPVGVECEWIGGGIQHGEWGLVIVHGYANGHAWIEKMRDHSLHTVGNPAHFRKPETESQRLKRERLEAAYELYVDCGIQHETACFEEWREDYSDVWLAIVDKTKYTKGR